MFIMALGVVTNYWVCLFGFCIVFAALYGWSFEPVFAPEPPGGSAEAHPAHETPREPVAAH